MDTDIIIQSILDGLFYYCVISGVITVIILYFIISEHNKMNKEFNDFNAKLDKKFGK
jgi:hypothetical protein